MPRYFNLEEAERTLARLQPELTRAQSLRSGLMEAQEELQEISRKVVLSGGFAVNREKVAAIKRTREEITTRLQQIVDTIQETGCLVKDVDMSLLDFPTLYRGREVYLCWKEGESSIGFWHDIDAGFRGRKPIDDDFLQNHSGGQ